MKRTFYFAIQSRLERDPNGAVRTSAGYARYDAWSGFLGAFDEVVLLARVEPAAGTFAGHLVEGPGVRVLELPYYRGLTDLLRRLPAIATFMARHLQQENAYYGARFPDVAGFLLQRRARQLGAPFLAQVVGDPVGVLGSGAGGRLGKLIAPFVARILRSAVKRASAVIYVTRTTLQKAYPSDPTAMVLVRSNVELPEEAVAKSPRDYGASPPSAPLRIITAGSQEQNYKGHDTLIESVAVLRAAGVTVSATIIGGGKFHENLVRLAEEREVSDLVEFAGTVPSSTEVRAAIQAADLFVLPSRTEGLPRVLIESMACGVASIASDVGGIPELLAPEWLFLPDDPETLAAMIARLASAPRELSRAAREQWSEAKSIAAAYSGDRILGEFLNRWTSLSG